jgi:hypothetical protein
VLLALSALVSAAFSLRLRTGELPLAIAVS